MLNQQHTYLPHITYYIEAAKEKLVSGMTATREKYDTRQVLKGGMKNYYN